ncbi:hypothetical protein B9Z55_012024 [Caenorhabditis nigoni]|uniref:Uncharacterized protein n=1 Tax=Caenorhabditis nigoni TaxID=1611254 RepID=A0A2G5TVH3_9PELO|nr:hypothetical protein B9Z55_012024 [Caenorhabditis nigoni]
MNILPIVFIFLLFAHETSSDKESVAIFRKKTLSLLNDARRLIASGDIRKILEVINTGTFGSFNKLLDYFGPAKLMYKLVWNRQLELASYEYMYNVEENLFKVEKEEFNNIQYNGYIGFYWLGDLMKIVKVVLGFLPEKLQKKAGVWFDVIQSIIMLGMMAAFVPKTETIPRGKTFGPAELMFGKRFEIGCTSNLLYSLCFVKKLEYEKWFFEIGASCFGCPNECEFWYNDDGSYEEGDLCIPPRDFYAQQISERESVTESIAENGAIIYSTLFPIIMNLIYSFF